MDNNRRDLLIKTALAASATMLTGVNAAAAPRVIPPGKPGEFDFLIGEWRIKHRRLRAGQKDWDAFEGEASCWSILGGVASIEELRIPARDFSGMGLRVLDVEKKLWSDYWVNAKSGVLGAAGVTGGFIDGAGIFDSDDIDGETPIIVRGVWDEITNGSCRWRQGVSRDGGKSWDWNWIMNWTRTRQRECEDAPLKARVGSGKMRIVE